MRPRGRRPRPARRAVLIVCEGRNTEPCYFRKLVATLRLSATVAVEIYGAPGCTDPRGLVEFAMTKKREREHDARDDLTKAEFEDVWVVFDVEHPENGRQASIPSAVQLARSHELSIAISNPSFEVWYILHDRSTPPGLACSADALSVLGRILDRALDKSLASANELAGWAIPRTATALRHGERQDVFNGGPHEPSSHVPSATGTGVHAAVRSLVSMSSDAAGKRTLGFSEGD